MKRVEYIQIRVSPWEKNRIRGLAKLYAGGDLSLWIRHAAFNAERKFLVENKKAQASKSPGPKKGKSKSISLG